jgi:hypothetical protein
MGAGAQTAAQTPNSSQFLREAVSFAGGSSRPNGEGMDRGGPYQKAIPGTPRGATGRKRSEGDPMQPPSGRLLSMRPFERQYSMPMLYR